MDRSMSSRRTYTIGGAFAHSFFFDDVPNDEDDLRKMLHQNEEHDKICSDKEKSSDSDLPESHILFGSKQYSKSELQNFSTSENAQNSLVSRSPKSKRVHIFNKPSKNVRKDVERVGNRVSNSVVDTCLSEASVNTEMWQPQVMLTDIFEGNTEEKKILDSLMQFEASIPTAARVEMNQEDNNCLKPVGEIKRLQSKSGKMDTLQESHNGVETGLSGSVPLAYKRKLSSRTAISSSTKKPRKSAPDLKSESSPDYKSSAPEFQEAFKVKPARKTFSLMDMIKKYSENNPPFESKTMVQEENSVKSSDADFVQINNCSAENSQSIENLNDLVLSPTPSSESLPGRTTDDQEINMDIISVSSPLRSNGNVSPCFSKVFNGYTTPKNSLNEAGLSKSQDNVFTPTRMRTRIQTNSLVAINAKDLLSGKISLWNKADSPLKQAKPKISPKNVHSSKLKSMPFQNSAEAVSSSNEITKKIGNPVESPLENTGKITSQKFRRSSAVKCSASDSVTDDFAATDHQLPSGNDCELNNGYKSQCKSSGVGKNSVPGTDFQAIGSQQPLVTQPETLNCLPAPLFVNPFNAFNFVNSCTQAPSLGNQAVCPVVNQFPVQQQKPYSFPLFPLSPSITFPVCSPILQTKPDVASPQSNIQNNCIYQSAPNVYLKPQSDQYVEMKSNVNSSSFVSKSFSSNPPMTTPTEQLQSQSQTGPIIMHNSISSTCTIAHTEKVDSVLNSKQLKSQGFSFIKSLAESAKKLCRYDMSDFALRFFTEHDSFSKVTVKDFYLHSPLAETISSKLSETLSEFDDSSRVEYVFEDDFEEKPLRDVIKDYVSFHVEAIYKHPASKDYFVKKAFKYLPFRDCYYLSESLPKSSEVLNHQDMILFLSCSALLVIYDECKKRNAL